MKKTLIALVLLAAALPLGCKAEEETPPNPLATRPGFCKEWARAACQANVVKNCNANDADECISQQSDFCLGIVPEQYEAGHADACITAVKDAYSDAALEPSELAIVLKLAAPCDQLSGGTRSKGQSCNDDDECATAKDLRCIIKEGDADGTCDVPEEVGKGEACDGSNQVCAAGSYCKDGNCAVYKKAGATCDADYQCDPKTHCILAADDATATTCEVRLALNKDCASDDDCASGYCAIAPKEAAGQCASTIVLTRLEPLCANLRAP